MFRFFARVANNQTRARLRRAYANDVSNLFTEGAGEAGTKFKTIEEGTIFKIAVVTTRKANFPDSVLFSSEISIRICRRWSIRRSMLFRGYLFLLYFWKNHHERCQLARQLR